jgi:hypothetical protein
MAAPGALLNCGALQGLERKALFRKARCRSMTGSSQMRTVDK